MGKVKEMYATKKEESPILEMLRETHSKMTQRLVDNYRKQFKPLTGTELQNKKP